MKVKLLKYVKIYTSMAMYGYTESVAWLISNFCKIKLLAVLIPLGALQPLYCIKGMNGCNRRGGSFIVSFLCASNHIRDHLKERV